jgi:predicted  nucleic acid-binding Zn-ribbon protein
MNPDLERLILLQRAESELRRVEAELQEIPLKRAELEAALAGERGRLDKSREAQTQSQKARRQHEADLQDLEAKRSRYKGQLMEVKTNKEYTAMLHEIEGVEREIRGREDQILAEMERSEGLLAEVKGEEEAFKVAEGRWRDSGRVLDDRARTLEAERTRLGLERDAVAATVPADVLELFQRVAKLRGVAVAEARDGMCQVCHVKLRPQMFVDIKRNEDIQQCPACNRILYYVTPPAAAGAEP